MAEIPPRIPTDFYGSSKKVKRYMGDPFKIEIMVLWGAECWLHQFIVQQVAWYLAVNRTFQSIASPFTNTLKTLIGQNPNNEIFNYTNINILSSIKTEKDSGQLVKYIYFLKIMKISNHFCAICESFYVKNIFQLIHAKNSMDVDLVKQKYLHTVVVDNWKKYLLFNWVIGFFYGQPTLPPQ